MFQKKNQGLPYFNITTGITLFYIAILVLLPLTCLGIELSTISFKKFIKIISQPRVIAAYKLTFSAALYAALINLVFGTILAWVLVRYEFFGKKLIDAVVDLPFALPTAIAGISLSSLYAGDGLIGQYLENLGIKVVYTPLGIVVALVFVGLPFVVRTVEPVLQDLEKEMEEAALNLGASKFECFYKVILPNIIPGMITGFALAFARGIGEYGSVIFIAGNMPKYSEIIPLIITIKLEQYDYQGASAIAFVMLLISFVLLFFINIIQRWTNRYNLSK
jgi:sulfate transport system permease protein